MRRRLRFLVGVLAVAAILPLWKLFGVIVGEGDVLVANGRAQGVVELPIAALRGPIVDRNGAELAISLPRVRVAADARALSRLAEEDPKVEGRFVSELSAATDVEEAELIKALESSAPDDPWVKLIDTATPEQADAARNAMTEAGLLPALILEDTSVRVHPSGESGLRLVGTLGPDGPGPGAGVERALDAELQGTPGVKVLEQSPTGEVIAGSEHVTATPEEGASVKLTLDRNLQYEVERVLMHGVDAASAAGGVAVVGRPSTGELLAVAGVDRNPETGAIRLAESPKAFTDAHQAGSVFKLVPVSAAIEDGHVTPDTTLTVPDSIQLWDRTFTDHDPHPTEAMTVRDIVARSSNVGTIKIAQMLGPERLHDALVDFGFGSPTGVANPAESSGLLPDAADWNGPDIAASAIGTLQSATAVQLWAAYNVIANDGIYVAPRLVESVERSDGAMVDYREPRPAPGDLGRYSGTGGGCASRRRDRRNGEEVGASRVPGRRQDGNQSDAIAGAFGFRGRVHVARRHLSLHERIHRLSAGRRPPDLDHGTPGGRRLRLHRVHRCRAGVLGPGASRHPGTGHRSQREPAGPIHQGESARPRPPV